MALLKSMHSTAGCSVRCLSGLLRYALRTRHPTTGPGEDAL